MPAELDAMLRCHAHDHAYQLEIFYTNIEGDAINRIYQAVDEGFDGLVMNPAGFTYAGFALKDCIKAPFETHDVRSPALTRPVETGLMRKSCDLREARCAVRWPCFGVV